MFVFAGGAEIALGAARRRAVAVALEPLPTGLLRQRGDNTNDPEEPRGRGGFEHVDFGCGRGATVVREMRPVSRNGHAGDPPPARRIAPGPVPGTRLRMMASVGLEPTTFSL